MCQVSLLQNESVLLQNATVIAKCQDFITKCDVYRQIIGIQINRTS